MREEPLVKVAAYAKKRAPRPILIGEVSLMLKWSLDEAEALVLNMVHLGILRQATKEESRYFDVQLGYFLV